MNPSVKESKHSIDAIVQVIVPIGCKQVGELTVIGGLTIRKHETMSHCQANQIADRAFRGFRRKYSLPG
jgi:hypothetical protein